MRYRKPISLFVIAAFLLLTASCVRERQYTQERLSQAGAGKRIVRILKKTGETFDFDKRTPAVMTGDEIRFWERVTVSSEGATITKRDSGYLVKTRDGATYEASSYTQDGSRLMLNLTPARSIPLSDVQMVWTRESNDLGTVLLVVGGVIVAAGIAFLIVLATKDSCPFLYASDGAEFALEGELYSGAIFKGIERRDFLKLHSLAAGPDGYVLKIANEVQETQYTDEMSLLVVDHPHDIGVYAGADGLLHTVRSPSGAISAVDTTGRDFTKAVSAADGRMWSSNPVGKDPENPADWRSGLTLRFPKPAGAERAKLAVRIGNTHWADTAFGEFLGMMGGMMPAWYENTGKDPAVREKAGNFMSNMGLALKVQVLGREGWRDAGSFYPTGPFGIEDDIIALPLERTADESLTVRLLGGTFFWMVDYAAVDYSPDLPVDVRALSPYSAEDGTGRDIRKALLAADGDYFVMPEPGNSAVVKYTAPARKPGLERSFFLRSSGYYTIHPKANASPDFAKLLAIRQNPDMFLKFSLQEIQGRLAAAANPGGASTR